MNLVAQRYWQVFLTWVETMLPKLLGALLVLAIGYWLSKLAEKLIRRALTRTKTDMGIITFLGSMTKAALQIIVFIMAAAQLGLPVNSLITALGAAGLAIGLALKDSMTNIASGMQIVFTKPFIVGDYLSLDGVEGTVQRIEMMFTVLKTFDNKEIIVPNSKITVSTIVNYSAMETRRLDLKYSIGYQDDIEKVKQILLQLVQNDAMVLKEPEPIIMVGEHQESSVQILVKLWCRTDDYWTLYGAMQEKVKLMFDEEGIHIPYPQLDVHMKQIG